MIHNITFHFTVEFFMLLDTHASHPLIVSLLT